jgi:hypothetical protein
MRNKIELPSLGRKATLRYMFRYLLKPRNMNQKAELVGCIPIEVAVFTNHPGA